MLAYLLIINAAAFVIMCADKFYAKHTMSRIPEKALFLLAVFGGSGGCLLAMHLVRHKTRHRAFLWGIPILLIIQIVILSAQFT